MSDVDGISWRRLSESKMVAFKSSNCRKKSAQSVYYNLVSEGINGSGRM